MMTPYERTMAVLSGQQPDRVPVMPWVRDWCAVQAGFGIVDIMENVEKYVFCQYEVRKRFGYDAVFDLWGVNAESEAMGTINKYDNETPPMAVVHPVQDYARDLPKLRLPDPHKDGRLPMILEGVRRLKNLAGGEVPVIGYIQGPLRHAAMLRGPELVLRDMFKNKEPLREFLDLTTDSLMIYGVALAHAGADAIIMSDPTSSGDMLSRKMWEIWVLPNVQRIAKTLKRAGTKVIFHVCGDTTDRLETFSQLGVDCLSLDEKVDLATARRVLGEKTCLFGNVSTTHTLLGSPAEVEAESKSCIDKAGRDGPFILGSGCLVPSIIAPDNIRAMVQAAEEHGTY